MHETLEEHPHLLAALDAALRIYDEQTQRHAARVQALAVSIGERLGIAADAAEAEALGWAARLHDLGKLAIGTEVLMKTGGLSDREWTLVKRHPIVGSEMLLAISPRLEPIAAGVRSHHERWDGAGYPDGLAGAQIPRIAWIIAVADSFDSMTSPRPYRQRPLKRSEALALIGSESGSHFDPIMAEIFLTIMSDAASN